jgi:hypothetical protein
MLTLKTRNNYIRFEVLAPLVMKSCIFWDTTLCCPLLATCIHAVFLLGLFFDSEDGGDMSLRNISWLSTYYKALYPRRQNSSKTNIHHIIVTEHPVELVEHLTCL